MAGTFFKGLVSGISGMFGGDYDPFAGTRDQISKDIDTFNDMNLSMTVAAMMNQSKIDAQFYNLISASQNTTKAEMNSLNQNLLDSLSTTNLFVSIVGALIMVIIVYLLIKK